MITAGNLNKRITFQAKGSGTDADGYPVEEWLNVISVWSMVKPVSAMEYSQAKATQTANITRFVIRYRTDIDEDMVILYKGLRYEIESILNDDEQNKTLTIMGRGVS